MPNQFYAFALIILAALPGSGVKANLENRLTNALLGTPNVAPITLKEGAIKVPYKIDPLASAAVTAKAAYFIDLESGEVLFARNENLKLPMASTTKLMTALIALEKLDLDKVVTVGSLKTLPLDAVMGLGVGDRIKVNELMNGLLIPSGADAAETLAVAAAGSQEKFVTDMNEKAANFGLNDTQFSNPVGRDDANNLSTAKDLAHLTRLAMSNKQISAIVAKGSYTASSVDGKKYYLVNTNYLLSDPKYRGVKTGTTFEAGQCLISLYEDGDRKILGVILASPDRFSETRTLIEWVKSTYRW